MLPRKSARFLHKAAWEGNEEIVKKLLDAQAPIYLVYLLDESDWTAFHIAAFKGHAGIIAMLIEAKANMEVVDDFDMTPLHMAILEGHENAVGALIEGGANIQLQVAMGIHPYLWR